MPGTTYTTMHRHIPACLNPQIYRVSIKSFPDYEHLLQENYVEYRLFFSKCNGKDIKF